jgi:hypothetical protein
MRFDDTHIPEPVSAKNNTVFKRLAVTLHVVRLVKYNISCIEMCQTLFIRNI